MNTDWKTCALINLSALRDNINTIRRLTPKSKLIAVVKANAYGHDMEIIVQDLKTQVDGFAVATIEEGIFLRKIDSKSPLLILSGLCLPSQLRQCASSRLEPVIHSFHQVKWIDDYSGKPIDIWLKCNTGMNRLGMDHYEFGQAFRTLERSPHIASIRLISHFAIAEDWKNDFTNEQIQKFIQITTGFERERSLANSAGIMCWPDSHFEWVRPGIMLYGISPLDQNNTGCGLRPVMKLQARVISFQRLKQGDTIGYGRTYTAPKSMKIANLGIGYGDGFFRMMHDSAYVVIHKQKAPIVGRISMDSMTVDVSNIENVQTGDWAVLWGEWPSVNEVATWAGTNTYEIVCKLSTRVPRKIEYDA
ncbi:MAG: alanine racemase [Gammaproteobacteria bacterium]|nr:alanine racemase [Gammaproteobacteria bacterium]MCY4275264.1 alanine racemase [Gammaproteobacteria bacterium]